MNNIKTFKILYYLCFVLSILYISILYISILSNKVSIYTSSIIQTFTFYLFGILNLLSVIIFSVSMIKKRELKNINILFPIIYLVFFASAVIISILYNSKLIIPYIHFGYYLLFIMFNYLLLNIYTLLSINKK